MPSPSQLLPSLLIGGVLLGGLAACSGEDAGGEADGPGYVTGPTMFPGRNCLGCHAEGFGDPAPSWSAGGTLYQARDSEDGVEGAVVTLTDALGMTATAVTNSVGNFYFPEGLEAPFWASIEYEGETIEMPFEAPAGSCNACHTHPSPLAGAPGRLFPSQGRGDWAAPDAG